MCNFCVPDFNKLSYSLRSQGDKFEIEIGDKKIALIKEVTGKILGKLLRTTKIPFQGYGMAAISKIWKCAILLFNFNNCEAKKL